MNNLFQQLMGIINGLETYHKAKTGQEKKDLCIKYMESYVNSLKADDIETYLIYSNFIDHYMCDMIDMIVFLVKNKDMIKLFKSGRGCFNKVFGKKGKEADKTVDEILNGPI